MVNWFEVLIRDEELQFLLAHKIDPKEVVRFLKDKYGKELDDYKEIASSICIVEDLYIVWLLTFEGYGLTQKFCREHNLCFTLYGSHANLLNIGFKKYGINYTLDLDYPIMGAGVKEAEAAIRTYFTLRLGENNA